MTIRERAADLIDPRRRKAMEHVTEVISDEIKRRPWGYSNQALLNQLKEVDSRTLERWLRAEGRYLISGMGMGKDFMSTITDQQRVDAVNDSRYMYWQDVTVRRAITMFTDSGFGQYVSVTPEDEALDEIWEEFWTAKRNSPLLKQRKLHELSNDLVTDGEYFFVFTASTSPPFEPIIRRLRTEEIAGIVYEENDKDVPIFYRRPVSGGNEIWYPDWQATEEQLAGANLPSTVIRADEVQAAEGRKPGTQVLTMQVAMNEINSRGWPVLWAAFKWVTAYEDFLGDRSTIAKAVAMFVDTLTADTGQRGLDSIVANLQTSLRTGSDMIDKTPPAATGSTWVQNQAIKRERLSQSTGAGDAQIDGLMLLGQVNAGSGVALDWLGRPDAMQNRAVADHAGLPWMEQMERYQEFWTDVFGDMVEIIAIMDGRATGTKWENTNAAVTLQSPIILEPETLAAQMDAVVKAGTAGMISPEVAERAVNALMVLALNRLGVHDTEAIIAGPEEEEEDEAPSDLLELFDSQDAQMRAMLDIHGETPEEMREAIDLQVWVISDTILHGHKDLRPKAAMAVGALMEMRRRYE